MFDKHYHEVAPAYPQKITIKEHRQSTADDARLLSDLEKQAQKKITDVYLQEVGNNQLGLAILNVSRDELNLDALVYAHFTLNGEQYEVKARKANDYKTHISELIFKALAEGIAAELMKELPIELRWRGGY